MVVRVVTDSTSDIPPDLAAVLGITIVPIYVRFEHTVYRDGVDIDPDRFFQMLTATQQTLATSQPNPEDFEHVYTDLCAVSDGIVSVHISSKISGTCNSARIARNNLAAACPIVVIDSGLNSAGLALVTMAAAASARQGKDFQSVIQDTRKAIEQSDMFGFFATMKYLARSGRVNKTIGMAASILNVMPLLTFHEGEIIRAGLVRSISKGVERLISFVEGKKDLVELIVVHAAVPDQAVKLKQKLGWFFPEDDIKVFPMGAGLGVHGGPGVLLVGTKTATPSPLPIP